MTTWYDSADSGFITVKVGAAGKVSYNEDPSAPDNVWINQDISAEDLYGVAWNGNMFMAVGGAGVAYRSQDGKTWYSVSSGSSENLNSVASAGLIFIICGDNGTLIRTDEGVTWVAINSGTINNLWDVTVGSQQYTAVGEFDTVIIGDLSSNWKYVDLYETVNTNDSNSTAGSNFNHSVSETSLTDDITGTDNEIIFNWVIENIWAIDAGVDLDFIYDVTITDDAGVLAWLYWNPEVIGETVALSDIAEYVPLIERLISENINLSGAVSADVGAVIRDAIGFNDTLSVYGIRSLLLQENISVYDILRLAYPKLTSETVGVSDTLDGKVYLARIIAESLVVNDIVPNIAIATELLAVALVLSDLTEYSWEYFISENINVSEIYLDQLIFYKEALENVNLTSVMQDSLVLYSLVGEDVNTTDGASINQTIYELLQEGITFQIFYGDSGQLYTGWVMNTENRAVTKYDNYAFNSFQEYNQVYYGSKEDGIYQLEGTTDAGTVIRSIIKTAMFDFGTSNLKAITQAYLGYTCSGDLVMKVLIDDEFETWYQLVSSSDGLHMDRLKLSKGAQGRYFQFELQTLDNNTELELDTLELFPIVLKRKL